MSNVILLGVCGRKRHGKDTVGRSLRRQFDMTPIAFADPLKRIAMDIYGLSYDQCYGDDLKEVIDPRWGVTPRHIMQQIGTEMGRTIHPETWVRYCLRTIEEAAAGKQPLIHIAKMRKFELAKEDFVNVQRWVVTDVRFPNEAEAIRSKGGKVIKVVRSEFLKRATDMHASETSIDEINPDFLVLNDSTIEDLNQKVLDIGRTLALP